jgi:N-acetylneuraminic acid mutarotase
MKKWIKYELNGDIPLSKAYHSSVIYNGFLYLYGGSTKNEDLFKISLKSFYCQNISKNISGNSPKCTLAHSSTLYINKMFVFGGLEVEENEFTNNLYVLDLTSLTWELLNTPSNIKPRGYHSSVLYKDEIYFYGGFNKNHCLSDFSIYNIKENTWRGITYYLTKYRSHFFWE